MPTASDLCYEVWQFEYEFPNKPTLLGTFSDVLDAWNCSLLSEQPDSYTLVMVVLKAAADEPQ